MPRSLFSEGWSIKKQIRFLVLSQAFQQSSKPVPEVQRIDPLNRLLSHYPVRRLEGESIRDAILAVSGRLDPALYGQSIQPHREEPKDYRKLYQGPLDGDGRRSIYLKVTRHEGSRFLETFDFPNPTVARGNRDSTNVPPQALTLLNDPFVIEQAQSMGGPIDCSEGSVSRRRGSMPCFVPHSDVCRMMRSEPASSSLANETASLHHVESGKLLEEQGGLERRRACHFQPEGVCLCQVNAVPVTSRDPCRGVKFYGGLQTDSA